MSYKAFVSSTFIDLKEHRAHVIDALRKAGIQVDPMEDWTADSDEPKQISVDRMRDCDLCILLVGARRGHRPKNETLSVTQMEVNEAAKRGIDVLAFLYDGESAWPPAYYELNVDAELKHWRADLMEHTCVGKFTHEAVSLDAQVRDAIARWLQKQSWPEVHKTYLETLRDAHASIRFLGVGQYKDIQNRPIEDLFVDPCTASHHISPDMPVEQWHKTSPLLDVVSREKHLVLLGDPGSGKSTLVSWIVWSLTQERENPWKQALKDRTPIVMVLRELSLDHVRTWNDLLLTYFKHWTARLFGRSHYASHVGELFESGRAMIILDGIDEIGNREVQEKLRQAVWEGMRRYGGCAWLITSRVVGYINYHDGPDGISGHKRQYAKLQFLSPFADHQIKKFAQNWFTTRDKSAIRANEDAKRLIGAIHSNPYTLRLARIPNLLTMMALIHRERARLPHGRALLYSDIANAYLQSIDEHRRIERLGYSLRDQKLWLGRIGFEMQIRRYLNTANIFRLGQEKDILVEGQDVRQWLVGAMCDAGRTDSNEEAAGAFLDEICRRSGLLLERGEDVFAFTHLSFQEFFAAVFLVPKFVRPPRRAGSKGIPGTGHEDMHSYAEKKIWHETLVFFVELIFSEHPDWLEELLFCLFGEGFSEVTPRVIMEVEEGVLARLDNANVSKAVLLARLAVDPHTGLAERGLKSDAILRCCEFESSEQAQRESEILNKIKNGEVDSADTFQILLGSDREDLPRIWTTFTDSLRKAGVAALTLSTARIESLAPLASLSELKVLDLYQTGVTNLSPLSSLTSLHTLDLRNNSVMDMDPLAALTNLQSLYLSANLVGDVRPLSCLARLQLLDLTDTNVVDLSPLAGLTGLQSLNLSSTQVIDVSPLAGLTGLEELDLSSTEVIDVSPLAGLTGLQSLNLSSTEVIDVSPLAGLTGLEKLDLGGTQVIDISPLTGLTGLQSLNLDNTEVSDISTLAGLRGLHMLVLSNTKLSDVSPLFSLCRLRWLDLSYTQVSDVTPLSAMTGLQELIIRNTFVRIDDLRALEAHLPKCRISYEESR